MHILQTYDLTNWQKNFSDDEQKNAIEFLENGGILYFPQLPFLLEEQEKKLLSLHSVDPTSKNISFNPVTEELRGLNDTFYEKQLLFNFMQRYYSSALLLTNNLLAHYMANLKQGKTSFRPVEVKGRVSSYRKDDTRLHVDAFPSNPNQGQRILRVFTNINPNGQDRVWRVGEPFEKVAQRFASRIYRPIPGSSYFLQKLGITKSKRTLYDHYMLNIHNKMKADEQYQHSVAQTEVHFPPGSSWIVMTDVVSHAAMSGQHVLEQTFYLPVTGMQNAQRSPLQVLEREVGKKLV